MNKQIENALAQIKGVALNKALPELVCNIAARCEDKLIKGEDQMNKFIANCETDPLYAFEWGDTAVTAAANIHVAKKIAHKIGRACNAAHENILGPAEIETLIVDFIKNESLYFVRCIPHSSNRSHNLVHTERNAVWGEWLNMVEKKIALML